jgi:hypothetical protein
MDPIFDDLVGSSKIVSASRASLSQVRPNCIEPAYPTLKVPKLDRKAVEHMFGLFDRAAVVWAVATQRSDQVSVGTYDVKPVHGQMLSVRQCRRSKR